MDELLAGFIAETREILEMIRDPLTHIVRNAVDHGIEPPAERIAAGKPSPGGCAAARARRATRS